MRRSFFSTLFFGFLLALVSLQNDVVVDARIHASGDDDAAAIPVKRQQQQQQQQRSSHLWETYSRGVVVANVPSVGMLLLRMLQLLLSPPFEIWPSNNNPGHGTTTEIFSGGSGSSSDSAAAAAALSAGSWVFALLLCVQVVTKVVLASHAWGNNLTFYLKPEEVQPDTLCLVFAGMELEIKGWTLR